MTLDDERCQQDDLDCWLEALKAALDGQPLPARLPEEAQPAWSKLVDDLVAIRQFTKKLAAGDLTSELYVRGQLAGSLKALQANLRHLTWQVQQVAQGDYTQRIDFMGDFSEAFHQMTDSLRQARADERAQRLLAEALRDTAAALNSALGLEDVLDVILSNLNTVVPHDTLDVFLVDADGIASAVRSSGYEKFSPEITEQVKSLRLPVASTPNLRQMSETHEPCLVDDLQAFDWVHIIDDLWARSFLGVPILIEGRVVGFLSLLSTKVGFFSADHASRLKTFANQAAIALQKVRLIERLNWLATTDALTGIANRRRFMEQAEMESERALRYQKPLSALMMDIDLFKTINDTYGHAAGDKVLMDVAQEIKKILRVVDLMGRYGGEEFVALLPETLLEDAHSVAERLREAICQQAFSSGGEQITVTISIGVSALRGGDDALPHLLNRADQALYMAKQAGRNRVSVQA